MFVLAVVCALGCGLVGGVFFAFSTFVMKGLVRLPPGAGVAAMQSINVAAPTPGFMSLLFGTAAACTALGGWSLSTLDERGAAWLVVGSVLYLVVIGLTIGYHVPRNNALAAVDPTAPDAARLWTDYASGWTTWNHVRTAASLAAAATLMFGLRAG